MGKDRVLESAYLDGNNVILGREDGLVVDDLKDGWVGPVKVQTAGVDGPLEVAGEDEAKTLDGEIGNIGDIKSEVRNEVAGVFVTTAGVHLDGAGGGWVCSAGGVVSNDAGHVIWIRVASASGRPAGAEPVVSSISGGFDNDIVSLANGNEDRIGLIGDDRNQVMSDDGERVA